MISFSPSEEQKMVITTMKQFATDEIRKIYRDCDEEGEIPESIIEKAWEFGLIAGSIPESLGGFGSEHSAVSGALVAEELAWGDLSMAMHFLSPALTAFPILEAGTEEQKAKYLPLFCEKARKYATAALLEPRFNFDLNELATSARLDGSDYVLNGEKCYVPLAANADLMIIYASLDGDTQGFIVEKGTSGLEVGEREKNMGIKALATYKLGLKDCRVPKSNRLGGEAGCDFTRIQNYSQVALSSMAVGVAKAAHEYALEYAKQRYAWGEPIASRQAIAFMLAEQYIDIEATRPMTWEAAWELDRGMDANKDAYLTKMYADDMVMTVTDRSVQVLGGHGYIREHPVELYLRNGRGFATFDGMAIV
ncbi:MAG: acyl-CoA dehydrogenase family protein [Chloroflexota bacterium]|nr:acyl-CoA dehydrogenase family protein [Chloroflexota bacterium]